METNNYTMSRLGGDKMGDIINDSPSAVIIEYVTEQNQKFEYAVYELAVYWRGRPGDIHDGRTRRQRTVTKLRYDFPSVILAFDFERHLVQLADQHNQPIIILGSKKIGKFPTPEKKDYDTVS